MSWLSEIEGQVLLYIQEYLRFPVLDKLMVGITSLGNAGIVWIVATIVMLLIEKYRKTGIMMTLALIFSAIITSVILKNVIERVRPYEVIEGLKILVDKPLDWSFPSGHSSASIATSAVMLKELPKKIGVPTIILGILICFSRLYVGVHYPTDVIGGIIVGLISAYVGICVVKRYNENGKRQQI